MGIFSRKPKKIDAVIPMKKDDFNDMSELNGKFGDFDIDEIIKKDFSYDQFQVSDQKESGNYFGSEFDIQATIGRLKALYLKEPWVNTCSSLIARNLVTVPFRVYSKSTNEVIKNHPLEALINTGNYITSKVFRDSCSYTDLVLAGNYFLILTKDNKSCFWVPVESVTPNLRNADTEENKRKIIEVGPLESITIGENSLLRLSEEVIPFERVIHIKLPNPFNPFYGLPLIIAASRPILLDRYKNEYEMAFYLRGGMHSGVIETEQDISKTRMERLMRTFEQAFTGKRNWWRQLFLPKGAKWINSTLSMAEMQHLESLKENRTTLLANLGIPPSQVGIVQDVNRSTAEDQKANLWNNTIVPLSLMIESGWNSSHLIKNVYKDKFYIKADFEGLDALEGSFYTKCELGDKAKSFMTIDEIREFILNIPKLGDERGKMFVAEIVKSNTGNVGIPAPTPAPTPAPEAEPTQDGKALTEGNTEDGNGEYRHVHFCRWDDLGNGTTIGSVQGNGEQHQHDIKNFRVIASGDDSHTHPSIESSNTTDFSAKKKAVSNQSDLEKKESKKYKDQLEKYFDVLMANARYALRSGKDIGAVLASNHVRRRDVYISSVTPVAYEILDRSFNMSTDNSKKFTAIHVKAPLTFSPTDDIAIEAIRQRTKDEQREILRKRLLDGFVDASGGIDAVRSEEIMQLIEDGLSQGKTNDAIAQSLAADYQVKYGYRVDTIVRTEILSSISQGIEWNHRVLGEVFTETKKQWFHVGDELSNPDARKEHADFEKAGDHGVVSADYLWYNPTTGSKMAYPRDPIAGAKDIINCRCTMVTIIPKEAKSRSDLIVNS
jgi:HK97 family phage portal protein